MSLIIDGYNLLHATGIIGRGIGPGTLERSRGALLNCLLHSLPESEHARTIVVFDAPSDSGKSPRRMMHGEMVIYYSAGYEDADSLIEELIVVDSAPRRLTVVSSDHRIQRAARRRRAEAIDSDVWYARLLRERCEPTAEKPAIQTKPLLPISPQEIEFWLKEFAQPEPDSAQPEGLTAAENRSAEQPVSAEEPPVPTEKPPVPTEKPEETFNPFPPGYGEDLSEDDV